jgi:hypothetical protein
LIALSLHSAVPQSTATLAITGIFPDFDFGVSPNFVRGFSSLAREVSGALRSSTAVKKVDSSQLQLHQTAQPQELKFNGNCLD